MRFRRLTKWENPENCRGLVYFAQLLEEMLFDFSLDTYKASVMQTGTLCIEALETIHEVDLGNIKAPNIQHVIAELCTTLEKDSVAQALLPLPKDALFPSLKNPKTPTKELQNVLELLIVQLGPSKYREKNEELLINELCGTQAIPNIRRLARSYVTTLIATGFSQRHLLETTLDFFYHGQNRIVGPADIANFFARFPQEKGKFTVIFKVDSVFAQMQEALSAITLIVTAELPPDLNLNSLHSFTSKDPGKPYAVIRERMERDIYSARSSAEKILKLGATLLTLFHHKEHPGWRPECVVVDTSSSQYKIVQKPINSMHKCADLKQPVASKKLQLFMREFSLEKSSFSKFVRSVQLHSMALESNADENQILNLWISLESLVPSETKGEDISNIEHITNSVLPFLNIGYIDRLLNNLVKDLLRWNSAFFRTELRPVQGKKFTDKLAKVLSLSEFEPIRVRLEGEIAQFPLLKDRLEYFKHTLSSPTAVLSTLEAHKTRIEWQIRRIYRARNIIVHSGKTPAYTPLLIAHTHDYLDTVLSTLVTLASKPKIIHSVGQGFKFIDLKYSAYLKRLSEKGLSFTSSNIDLLLFDR
jgi:hypothetical protein